MWEILENINSYLLTNDTIIDFAIYLKESDIVISLDCINTLDSFYDSYFQDSSLELKKLGKSTMETYYNGVIIPSLSATINGKQYEVITYLQTIPIGYTDQPDGFIMIYIDQNKINTILNHAITGGQGYVYIKDQNGNYITGTSKGDIPTQEIQANFEAEKNKGFTEEYINNKLFTITHVRSDRSEWTYIIATPTSLLMDKVDYIKNITRKITLVSLIAGLSSAYFFAQKNTRPLKTIMGLLREFLEYDNDKILCNEFTFLKGTILELINHNHDLYEAINRQKPILENIFLNRLLVGDFNNKDEIDGFQRSIDLHLEGNYFVILLVKIKGYDRVANPKALQELNGIRIIIKEMLHTYLGQEGYCLLSDNDEIIILLADDCGDLDCFKSKIENISKAIYGEIREKYKMEISFYIGNIYSSLDQVYLSYDEAKQVRDNRYSEDGRKDIIWYYQIPLRYEQYTYSIEQELRLMNLAKAGNQEEIKRLLKKIYIQNFIKKSLTTDMKKQLLADMRGTVIKISDQLNLYEVLRGKISLIDYNNDEDKFYELLIDIYTNICDLVNKRMIKKDLKLEKQIKKYIHDSFTNSNLSLSCIANEVGFTEQYVSRFFKEQTGYNFSRYLEKLRIDYACKLLQDSNLSINEVSLKVGYNSDRSFRRAFRRVKGVNPTAFRKLG